MRYQHIILGLLLSLATTNDGRANEITSKATALKQIKQQIRHTRQHIRNAQGKRAALETELKGHDIAIHRHQNHLIEIRHKLRAQKQRLHQAEQQLKQAKSAFRPHQRLLSQQVYLSYRLENRRPIKMMLNIRDLSHWQRQLSYYGYLNRARLVLTQALRQKIIHIHQIQSNIEQQNRQLKSLEKAQLRNLKQLKQAKYHQLRVLKKLKQGLSHQQHTLVQLRHNEQNLSQLIHRLRHNHLTLDATTPFANAKGHLLWPVSGPLSTRHSPHKLGVFIPAADGQAVKAIYSGKVIFADWLKAYGLLIIIQHNTGFMSLYAHNEALYRRVGDQVKTGDIVSTVGHSGGNQNSGLYFELRHNGKAIDPRQWCQAKNRKDKHGV